MGISNVWYFKKLFEKETGATVEGLNGSGAGASAKVTAAALTADASGKITGGTLTLADGTSVPITVTTAEA